jgi:hypothetical protein
MFDRISDRLFRDLVEYDAVNGHLRLQQFEKMPADGLAFPVRIRREENFRRLFHGRLQFTDRSLAVR